MKNRIDKKETCESCDGEGKVNMTCCGINIHGNDSDLCPECNEHCGDESETCETCGGTGEDAWKNF
jgi:RecJ-like exonuclease